MRSSFYTIVFLFLFIKLTLADHDVCANNAYLGVNDPRDYDNDNPIPTANQSFLHTGATGAITCCGILDRMDVEIEGTAGAFHLQLWEPVTTGGYMLVAEIIEDCTNEGDRCTKNYNGAQRVTVKDGYLWGWWSQSGMFVEYDNNKATTTYKYTTMSQKFVGDTFDWSTVGTSYSDRSYGVRIDLDANNAPDLSPSTATPTISESAAAGTSVFDVTGSDIDVSDDASLSITMATNTYFDYTSTSSTTGTISVKAGASLGSAATPQSLVFTVEDQCHHIETRTYQVTITNEPPVFQNMPGTDTISELVDYQLSLYVINVTDNFDSVICNVAAVDGSAANTGYFMIEKLSDSEFRLSTSNTASFDFKTKSSHTLTIRCNDGDDSVDANFELILTPNTPPAIHNLPGSITIYEDVNTENLLITLNVTDTDTPLSISCDFAGTTSADAKSKFRIRKVNGTSDIAIYTRSGVSFNYTAKDTYNLDIECTDDVDSSTSTFVVYLLDNHPPWITNLPTNVTLSTNAPIGHEVFLLIGADIEGDDVDFDIISHSPTCSGSCPFAIFNAGHLKLQVQYDTLNAGRTTPLVGYDVTIRPKDAKNYGESKVLTVTFVDINDNPEITNLNTAVNIPENVAVGTVIGTTSCTDYDVPTDTLAYSSDCSPNWGSSLVDVGAADGVIATTSAINYEDLTIPTTFTCTITCTDGQSSSTATVDVTIVDVNEAPQFAQTGYVLNVVEGSAGTALQATAYPFTDPDSGDSHRFTLNCGAQSGYFTVGNTNGILQFATDIDVDSTSIPQSASCILTVTDSGGLSDTVSVNITISDANDNFPIFQHAHFYFFVAIETKTSTNIGSVAASDIDITSYGNVLYTLDQSLLPCDCFGVSNSGQLFVKNVLTTLGPSTVDFNVIATDGGGQQTIAPVTVIITEVTTPAFRDEFKTFFDDTTNIAWFSMCMVLLALIGLFIVYLVMTGSGYPSTFKCQCCKIRRVYRPDHSQDLKPRPSTRVFPQRRPDYQF